jgi:hypothetical protein
MNRIDLKANCMYKMKTNKQLNLLDVGGGCGWLVTLQLLIDIYSSFFWDL